jgi:heptosyltransferase-2
MPARVKMDSRLRRMLKKWLVEGIARRMRRPKLAGSDLRQLDPRRILIVRQHNQMGDMVCATPSFRALRQSFPGAKLALICAPLNYEVVRNNPAFSQVLVFNKRLWVTPWRLWGFWRQIRAFRPDLALVLNSVSFSVTSAAIALLSGAPIVVGGDSRPFGWNISHFAYSLELPSSPALDRHAVRHSLAPLEAVGIVTADLSTVVVPSPAEIAAAGELLERLCAGSTPWIIHPGAGKQGNLWPVTGFVQIAARAAQQAWVLILQGPADKQVMEDFRRALANRPSAAACPRIAIAPVQPVGVCAALLARAERFLCNDTGLMHVAGAVGVPTLALFGPTDLRLWKPQTPAVVALQAEEGSLQKLAVEDVWQAWLGLPHRQTTVA